MDVVHRDLARLELVEAAADEGRARLDQQVAQEEGLYHDVPRGARRYERHTEGDLRRHDAGDVHVQYGEQREPAEARPAVLPQDGKRRHQPQHPPQELALAVVAAVNRAQAYLAQLPRAARLHIGERFAPRCVGADVLQDTMELARCQGLRAVDARAPPGEQPRAGWARVVISVIAGFPVALREQPRPHRRVVLALGRGARVARAVVALVCRRAAARLRRRRPPWERRHAAEIHRRAQARRGAAAAVAGKRGQLASAAAPSLEAARARGGLLAASAILPRVEARRCDPFDALERRLLQIGRAPSHASGLDHRAARGRQVGLRLVNDRLGQLHAARLALFGQRAAPRRAARRRGRARGALPQRRPFCLRRGATLPRLCAVMAGRAAGERGGGVARSRRAVARARGVSRRQRHQRRPDDAHV